MAFLKTFIAFVAVFLVILLLWYFTTGFKLPSNPIRNVTTTIAPTTTVPQNISKNTTTTLYIYNCNNFYAYLNSPNSNEILECSWTGGPLGVWVSSGNYSYESVSVYSATDNSVYENGTANYRCMTFFDNLTVPEGIYKIRFATGNSINSTNPKCLLAQLKLNTTTTPPPQIYQQVYNGNFGNGKYTGWTVNGTGFGKAPLNITRANRLGSNQTNTRNATECYIGQPWSNYNGTFFATTYTCGSSVSLGSITSSPFYADQEFLNFKIVSPDNNYIYVEILYNGTPYTIAHYNTFNSSLYVNASSQFRNASIPLYNVFQKPISIRVVAGTLNQLTYVAVGDFALSSRPLQDRGILSNITFVHQ